METKICTKCKIEKPFTEYTKDVSNRDGLACWCKDCRKIMKLEYRRKNIAKIKKHNSEYYQANKEHVMETCKKWSLGHPEKVKASRKKYKTINKEMLKELNHKYHIEHPTMVAKFNAMKQARRYNATGNFTEKDYLQKLEDSGHRCYYCGRDLRELPTIQNHHDHVIPLSIGGTNTIDNIVPCCGSCNASKSNRTPEEYAEYLETHPKCGWHDRVNLVMNPTRKGA